MAVKATRPTGGRATPCGAPRWQSRVDPTRGSAIADLQRSAGNRATAALVQAWLQRQVIPGSISASKVERGLEFLAKWGRNASPFKLAKTYFDLYRGQVAALRDVSKRAASARQLLGKIDALEKAARQFRKATDELRSAEAGLPRYPLETDDKAGQQTVSAEEITYVKKYLKAAELVADEAAEMHRAMDAAVKDWDATVVFANNRRDFARKALVEAVAMLELRFQNEGGSFRDHLVETRDTVGNVETWARYKRHHAAHILGVITPSWYTPPSTE